MAIHPARRFALYAFGDWLNQHWYGIFVVAYGLFVWLPWLAPVSMHLGWDGLGRAIYLVYSFICHQLPERSFFFFGSKTMYSLAAIEAAWQDSINPFVLREFIGNVTMGWKLAWSDRMVSFYTSVWLFGVLWWPFRKRIQPLPVWGFALLLLPMVVDGGSHAVSDLSGIGRGFRDSNAWLANLTKASLPTWFYVGDALGSFNSWMRWVTGVLAGLGIPWLALPFIYRARDLNREMDELSYAKVLEQIKTPHPRPTG